MKWLLKSDAPMALNSRPSFDGQDIFDIRLEDETRAAPPARGREPAGEFVDVP